jgi:hypothetical protein
MRTNSRHLTDSDLLRFIDRQLSPTRQASADAHLGQCADCRARRELIDQAGEGAAAVYRLDWASPPGDRDHARARLQARIRTTAAEWDASWGFLLLSSAMRTPRWLRAGAAVAAVVLLVRAVPFVRQPVSSSSVAETDARPIASLTPGAVWTVNATELCDGELREQREVSAAIRHDVLRRYRMDRVPPTEYELDYLITPELGGAADARNLWPQRYASRVWNAHVKDQLERLLPQLVCRGEMELAAAQRALADDWIAAYKKHFHTSSPIRLKVGMIGDGDGDSLDADRITYPVWRTDAAPAVRLMSFSIPRQLATP